MLIIEIRLNIYSTPPDLFRCSMQYLDTRSSNCNINASGEDVSDVFSNRGVNTVFKGVVFTHKMMARSARCDRRKAHFDVLNYYLTALCITFAAIAAISLP